MNGSNSALRWKKIFFFFDSLHPDVTWLVKSELEPPRTTRKDEYKINVPGPAIYYDVAAAAAAIIARPENYIPSDVPGRNLCADHARPSPPRVGPAAEFDRKLLRQFAQLILFAWHSPTPAQF